MSTCVALVGVALVVCQPTEQGKGKPLEERLKPGTCAFAIKGTPETAAGGFILPGSRVDVIHTDQGVARMILQNVAVLAVDQQETRFGDAAALVPQQTITLEVDRRGAIALGACTENGTIRLALRPSENKEAKSGKLEESLKPDKRAFAVKASADTAAGGLILPGSRVDVLFCSKKSGANLILMDLRVLAVDQQWQRANNAKPSAPKNSITLELDDKTALILAKHQEAGTIRLVLRARADWDKPTIDDWKAVPPPPPPPPP